MKKKLEDVQIARAIAIFTVLFVHCSSTGLGGTDKESVLLPVYLFFNTLGKVGVPVFFMLSSLVLFYSYYPRDLNWSSIKSFYIKRIKYIIIPYISVSLFYFVFKYGIGSYSFGSVKETGLYFVNLIFIGKAHTHLYFLYVLIQFYLIFPFILYLFKKMNRFNPFWIVIGFVVQWAWFYVNKHYLQVPYRGSVFLSYFSFFTIGAVLGVYYNEMTNWLQKQKSGAKKAGTGVLMALGVTSLYAIFKYDWLVLTGEFYYIKQEMNPLLLSYLADILWVSYGAVGSVVILVVSNYILKLKSDKLNNGLFAIAKYSFGIYLIHPFFLIFFREAYTRFGIMPFHIWQLVTFLSVSALSFIITKLFVDKIKISWIFFGK